MIRVSLKKKLKDAEKWNRAESMPYYDYNAITTMSVGMDFSATFRVRWDQVFKVHRHLERWMIDSPNNEITQKLLFSIFRMRLPEGDQTYDSIKKFYEDNAQECGKRMFEVEYGYHTERVRNVARGKK